MLKARLLLIVGIWVAILPYLGFPHTLKNFLFSITGLFLVYVSFVIYKEYRVKKTKLVRKFENFSENVHHKIQDVKESISEAIEDIQEHR